jgi:anti-anti-sigma factor
MSPSSSSFSFADDPVPDLDVVVMHCETNTCILIEGEADIASVGALAQALVEVDVTNSQAVELHLAGLRFCDAAGLGNLADFARRVRAAGSPVTAYEPSAMLRKMAQLMSLENELGISDATSDYR